jgi:hypothetical protein
VSQLLPKIVSLISSGDFIVTEHAFEELEGDEIALSDIMGQIDAAIVVEDYPAYHKGPAVLLLTKTKASGAVHSLWGIPAGQERPASLITAYVPDPARWEPDLVTRRKR